MSFKEVVNNYYEFTPSTAIYPESNIGSPQELMYLTLGLIGETMEFLRTMPSDTENYYKEAGDVFWYGANISHCLGDEDFHEVILSGLYSAAAMAEQTKIHTALPQLCGFLAEMAKKNYRDGGEMNVETFKGFLSALLGVVGNALGEFEDVAHALRVNKAKLQDRQARNVLSGSGDNR